MADEKTAAYSRPYGELPNRKAWRGCQHPMITNDQAHHLAHVALIAAFNGTDPDAAVRRAALRYRHQTVSPRARKTFKMISEYEFPATVVVDSWEELTGVKLLG